MKTVAPSRMRLKQVMTATAMNLVMIRNTWRLYLRQLAEERQDAARRNGGV
jgi:hypothetical protein